MPIYEYKCKECNQIKEALQKISDAPLTQCSCGGTLERIVSGSSFILKGEGWYVSDKRKEVKKDKKSA